jgi:polyvinyl alcohol dehydrogenase (cytochrome)
MVIGAGIWVLPTIGAAQEDGADSDGARVFSESCVACHSTVQSSRAPGPYMLSQLTPRAIFTALEDGIMRAEGAALSREQRIAVAEYLTSRSLSTVALPESAYCSDRGFASLPTDDIAFMGFGGNLASTGLQDSANAGMTADKVSELELQWAFAMPDAVEIRSKPTVVGDTILVGDMYGEVYALDEESGCIHWKFTADSGIRGAILAGESPAGDTIAWFVDFHTNAYALNISNGELEWKVRTGVHSEASNTGTPALHDNRLIVPVSNMGVVSGANPTNECCTGSGEVVALDAMSGEILWRHRTIGEEAVPTKKNDIGTQLYGPSGAAVWASPTIDVDRGLVYVGTGENLTHPTTDTSDAILALDIETGKLAWSFQGTANDAFTIACARAENRENCPTPVGPDLDFGMAPILVTDENGKEMLVAGQKSGVVWALDPDDNGTVIWSTRVGKGSALGGIHWGMATDGRRVYATNADRGDVVIVDVNPDQPVSPGVYAINLVSGDVDWSAAAPDDTCLGKQGCFVSNSAAPAMIPGIVFAGGLDGYIRAYSAEDGSIVWEYDTNGEYDTVNGVPGQGGAIDGPGPVIANGTLYVSSGYGRFGQMPGNVLLAFRVPE